MATKSNASKEEALVDLSGSKAEVKFFADKDGSTHIVIAPMDDIIGSVSSTGKTYVVAYGKVTVNGIRIQVTATRNVESGNELPQYGYTDKDDQATLR